MRRPEFAPASLTSAAPEARPPSALLVILVLLLGLGVQARLFTTPIDLTAWYLLPVVAVWWAQWRGPGAIGPLVLLTLLPDVSAHGPFGQEPLEVSRIGFGISDTACLLSAGAVLAFSARSGGVGAPVVRRGWRTPLAVAGASLVLAAMDQGVASSGGPDLYVYVDALAVPAAVVAVLAVDWSGSARALGYRSGAALLALAVPVAVALLVAVRFPVGGVSVGVGSASASSLVSGFAFVAVLCGWVRLRTVVAVIVACAVAEQALRATVGPLGLAAFGIDRPSAGSPWVLAVQGACAAALGFAFREVGSRGASSEGTRVPGWILPAVLVALWVAVPLVGAGQVATWGPSAWAFAGVALFGGWIWRGRGAIGTPLAIVAGCAAAALALGGEFGPRDIASDLPTLAAVVLPYALCGLLLPRIDRAAPPEVVPDEQAPIDVSPLARIVQRVDGGAVLRAFGALLAPAYAALNLIAFAALESLGRLGEVGGAERPPGFTAMEVLAVVGPLAFVALDWMNRQDRLRVLAGLGGAALAAAGAGVAATAFSQALLASVDDDTGTARVAMAAIFALPVLAVALWLAGRSRRARLTARAIAALFALAGGAGAIAVLAVGMRGEEDRLRAAAAIVGGMALAAVIVAAWVRAIRLRIVLCEPHPRELLFGALRQRSFWVRMAALLGLPSQMWTRSALGRPATWAFLLSRPIVFVGAGMAWAGVAAAPTALGAGAAIVVAGHAAFAWGKRLAARGLWRPGAEADPRRPVLFLRSFRDDQFRFGRRWWQLRLRWFDLWSFRRNLDETMMAEVAQYGPVVALGRPGEQRPPFGAARYYARADEWQEAVAETARRAHAVVLVAGDSPGVQWEYELLRREDLLERTVLFLHPGPGRASSNRRAIGALLGDERLADRAGDGAGATPVAVVWTPDGPRLLTADRPSAAAYVVALRGHFLRIGPAALASALG